MRRIERNRRRRREGYSIVLVLVVISLAGAALFVVGRVSNDFLFESNQAHAEACRRNLAASALAWARQHPDRLRRLGPAGKISLDADGLKVRDARVEVRALKPDGGRTRVRLDLRFRCGRRHLKRTEEYVIIDPRK